ncbi:MAG: DUF2911 domain-containing protein [Ignavibacteriales bacterium]|nr:DUF2911 domain-containing protein [Ignavibacteriales bacterium]
MKKFYSLFLLIMFFGTTVFAQLDLPRLSQKATLTQLFGYTTITIEYSRPSVHERKIWDGLVPYNQVWRTGANEATTIQFNTDVIVNGNNVPAGRYSLFTIPSETEWTIILNKVDKQWGAFSYKQDQDLLRFIVTPQKNEFAECMLFAVSDISLNSAVINLYWENVRVSFKAEADVLSQTYAKIKDAIANVKSDDWQTYAASAGFAADNNVYLDEALTWIDKSISINANYFNNFVKAKIYFKKGNHVEALKYIDKAREAGRNNKEYEFFIPQIDLLEKEVKSKL